MKVSARLSKTVKRWCWDDDIDRLKVQYLGSSFFGYAKSIDFVEEFGQITSALDPLKLYQISKDGLRVNLKSMSQIVKKRMENLFHSLINIGTCSLHTVH